MAGYLLGFLGTLLLAAASYAMSFIFNPVTLIFVHAAAPLVRLLGKQPAIHGFSGMGSSMWISIFWPLTLAPLHWVNYQLLRGNHWGYAGMIAGTGFLLAFAVLMKLSGPASASASA